MANALYTLGRQAFLNGSISWSTDTIKVALVTSGYTPNLATHQFVFEPSVWFATSVPPAPVTSDTKFLSLTQQ